MTIGEQLRQARNARTLSIADVSKATKIQPWVIEALETDRLHGLMSLVYVKGFLTTYAKFLHLAHEPLVGQLPVPQPEPEPAPTPPAAPPIPVALRLPRQLLRRTAVVAVAAVAVAIVVKTFPWQRLSDAGHRLRAWALTREVAQREPETPQATSASRRAPSPRLTTRKPAQSEPTPTKVEAPPPVQPRLASVTPVRDTANLSPPALIIQPTHPLELSVSANQSTWIRVRADGKLLSQQWLKRGALERWTAKKRFELIVAKPSQVDVTLNGQSISPFAIAHRGRLAITHQGITRLSEDE